MKTMDIVLPEPRTQYEYFNLRMNWMSAEYISRSPFSTNIPVKGEATCWNCRKTFVGDDVYCSPKCKSDGEAAEDNWRNE